MALIRADFGIYSLSSPDWKSDGASLISPGRLSVSGLFCALGFALHSGQTCTFQTTRVVINVMLEQTKDGADRRRGASMTERAASP